MTDEQARLGGMRARFARFQAWEDDLVRRTPVDYPQNLRLADALYEEAHLLGAFPPADPMDGFEVDRRWADAVRRLAARLAGVDSPGE